MNKTSDGGAMASNTTELQADIRHLTDQPCCVGVDIGTTSVCAVVIRPTDGALLGRYTTANGADLPPLFVGDKRQDVQVLYGRVTALLDAVMAQYPAVCAIGITGQMHGMVCADAKGRALTPLYTWQDGRASAVCVEIYEKTGYRVAAGYGLATYYTLMQRGEVPAEAACICTVMDYTAARLCGVPVRRMHATNAASLGLYDLAKNTFDDDALRVLGIAPTYLPQVVTDCAVVGTYRGIPVSVPIGDNQASFLGAVRDPYTTVLANFGTGSQMTLLSSDLSVQSQVGGGAVEVRPFFGDTCLISGAALCGGRAYAMLAQFFRTFLSAAGYEGGELYDVLNHIAEEGLAQRRSAGQRLSVKTTFCGTRDNPDAAGEICGIREETFTPQAFAAGVLCGMAEELFGMYQGVPHVMIPREQEEAAIGAAMTAAVGAGYAESLRALGSWVVYQ